MEGLIKLWGCPNTVRRVLRGHNGWACVCFRKPPGGGVVQNLRRARPRTGSRIVKEPHAYSFVVAAAVEQESNYRGRLATGLCFLFTFQMVAGPRSLEKHEENECGCFEVLWSVCSCSLSSFTVSFGERCRMPAASGQGMKIAHSCRSVRISRRTAASHEVPRKTCLVS